MQDPNFEKQVQQKMEELVISPSDAVWAGVDAEINKGKKRRRPLFWLFFLLGLAVPVAGAYWLLYVKKQGTALQAGTQQKYIPTKKNIQQPNVESGAQNYLPEQDAKGINKTNPPITPGAKDDQQTQIVVDLPHALAHYKKVNPADKINNAQKNTPVKKGKQDTYSVITTSRNHHLNKNKNITANETGASVTIGEQETNIPGDPTTTKDVASVTPNQKSTAPDTSLVAKTIVQSEKKDAQRKQKNKDHQSIIIGVTGGAGVANIQQGLFRAATVSNNVLAASPGSSGIPNRYYVSSPIKPYFSFTAGVVAIKKTSKILSFSAGLSYHFFSTQIQTGERVDSSISILLRNSPAFAANARYNNGSGGRYINQYHFLELPVFAQLQLTSEHTFPILLEGGISVSRLIATNALHFDARSGLYYKNSDLFNKTQFNIAAALLAGIPSKRYRLQLGPQFQYGLSGLLNKNTDNNQHLFFGGLKFVVTPRKK